MCSVTNAAIHDNSERLVASRSLAYNLCMQALKGFRDFFETLGIPEDTLNAQEKSVAPEVIQEVIKTASTYDMIIKM